MARTIAVLLFALTLVSCGQDAPPPTTTTIPSVATPSFPPDTSMARIQQSGRLAVGIRFDQPGFALRNPQTGVVEGFDVEVAEIVAQQIFGGTIDEAARRIDYVETVPLNRAPFLQGSNVDVVVSTYAMNDLRNAQVDFAGPYYVARGDILVDASDTDTRSLGDLNGRPVCVQQGSVYELALRQAAPQASVINTPTLTGCIERMGSNEVVATLGDSVTLAGLVQANGEEFDLADASYSETPYGIGLANDDSAFQAFLGEVLVRAGDSGRLTTAFETTLGRLGLPTPPLPEVTTVTTTAAPAAVTTTAAPTTTVTVAPPG